ncbi:MAG: hypothetical protein K9G11_03365 [Rickettsiaceae bacterium]|nr:hypothetical protein [Rickettsiaceae bacterium]
MKELFILDCHVCSQAHTRNDASALPLEDVATLLTDPSFQQIRTHPHKFIPISPQVHNLSLYKIPNSNLTFLMFTRPTYSCICMEGVGCPGLPRFASSQLYRFNKSVTRLVWICVEFLKNYAHILTNNNIKQSCVQVFYS